MIKATAKHVLLALVLIVSGHALAEDKAIPDTQSADAATPQSKESNSPTIEDKLKAQKTQSTTTTIQTAAVNLLAYIKLNLDRAIAIIGIFIALFLFLVSRHSNKKSIEELKEFIKNTNAEKTKEDPEEAQRTVDSAKGQNLGHIALEIVEATKLQISNQYDKAISKWLAIATATEKNDKKTASMAYFSAAYLIQEYDDKYKENDEAKVNEVIDLYSKSIKLNPNHPDAYNNRGGAKSVLGKHEEAIADCTKAIKLKPDHPEAYNNLGAAKSKMGKPEEAIEDYNEAIKLKPKFPEAYSNRGLAKSKMGKHEEAIEDYNEAIKLKPDDPEAYNNRGVAKMKMGKHEEAIVNFNEAIKLKPDYPEAYSNRGGAKSDLGKHEDAISDYNEAIRLNPDYSDAYYNRGVAKSNLGKYAEAIADCTEAIRISPDYPEAYNNRGNYYREMGEYDAAMRDANKSIELKETANAYHTRAEIYRDQKELDSAITNFSKAIELDNKLMVAYLDRGKTCQTAGKNEGALADFKKVLELEPSNKEARNTIAAAKQALAKIEAMGKND